MRRSSPIGRVTRASYWPLERVSKFSSAPFRSALRVLPGEGRRDGQLTVGCLWWSTGDVDLVQVSLFKEVANCAGPLGYCPHLAIPTAPLGTRQRYPGGLITSRRWCEQCMDV